VGVTPVYGFPYPALTDPPNGPAQIQALAEAVEADLAVTDSNVAALQSTSQSLSNSSYIEYARSTDQSLGSGALQAILFDVVTKSSSDMTAATVSGGTEFTSAKAGRWLWITNGSIAGSAGGTFRAWWFEEPTGGARLGMSGTGPAPFAAAFSVSRTLTMGVGSKMVVRAFQDSGGPLNTIVSQAPVNVTARWLGPS
jgi:hypothetical protein